MAAPKEFSLESVRVFILEKGGKVTNHELVKHFKQFLTDPSSKEATRIQFKDYVNTLATIKQEDGEKYLVLKKKYYQPTCSELPTYGSPQLTPVSSSTSPFLYTPTPDSPSYRAPPPYRPPPDPYRRSSLEASTPSPVRTYFNETTPPPLPSRQQSPPYDAFIGQRNVFSYNQTSPPYDMEPSVIHSQSQSSSSVDRPVVINEPFFSHEDSELPPPAIPPRRKGHTRTEESDKENSISTPNSTALEGGQDNNEEITISVKERTQRFNKMASEVDLRGNNSNNGVGTRRENKSKTGDDDDTSSVGTMEPRSKEWMLAIARGDYHGISRLLREEPRLARRRDFVTGYTGLHWAAKHGNNDLIKMLAGTYKSDVNARTNAGCTALHIAAQQGHEEVFDLLVKTYGADANLRDYSGKKPRQYLPRQDTFISSDTYSKITAKRTLAAEKEAAGFLRIGSLNVRVKKTTEAFNNLLSSGGSIKGHVIEKMQKPWGSVDSLQNNIDSQLMPPPKQLPSKKKRPKEWTQTVHSPNSNPPTPDVVKQTLFERKDDESDSDSAYGFGTDWQNP